MVDWNERIRATCLYLGVAAFAHLAWEGLQLPLYTHWTNASRWEIAFAVIHCTVGDIVIALASFAATLENC